MKTFEQWWREASHRRKYSTDHPAYLAAQEAWQAAAEAAKATGTAGELFGYGSSEKKNCLLSKAQYDNCAPKNRTAYDIPLYAHSLPKCDGCKGYGVITHVSGQTPDNYQECNEECPECQGTGEAARQPAPVLACAMQAARDIEHERLRQHWQEGWTDEKDDQYVEGELSRAAACYASYASAQQRMKVPEAVYQSTEPLPQNYFGWPWAREWWKPQNPRRDLVKAGALILAEIERLDRAATNRSQPPIKLKEVIENLYNDNLDNLLGGKS